MTTRFKTRNIAISVFVFFMTLVFSYFFIKGIKVSYTEERKSKASYVAMSCAEKFTSAIDHYSEVCYGMGVKIITEDGNVNQFDQVATIFMNENPSIKIIHISPNGLLRYIYPASSADLYPLAEIISAPRSRNKLENIKNLKIPSIDPINSMIEDYVAFNMPIFTNQERTDFWGLITLFIDTDEFFETLDTKSLEDMKYKYVLYREDQLSGGRIPILTNTSRKLESPQNYKFKTLNLEWTLSLYPQDGWVNRTFLAVQILAAVVVSLLLALITSLVLYLDEKERILSTYSYEDNLTKLYNSRRFYDELKRLQKNDTPYGIFYLDLNDFKPVNDTYGHQVGDELLSIVGRKLSSCIKGKDMAFRLGGDEFAIIMIGSYDTQIYEQMKERVRQSIENQTTLGNLKIITGISIGYARSPQDGRHYDSVIKKAENLMYSEKKQKGAR